MKTRLPYELSARRLACPEDSMAGTALVKGEGDVMIKTEDEMDDMMIKQELDIGPILLQSKVTCSALSPSDQLTTILRRYLGMFFSWKACIMQSQLAELKVFLMSKVATRQYFFETPFHLVLAITSWVVHTTKLIASRVDHPFRNAY
ncbi:hypothetical protein EVAR_102927_1 [Eumeta japonica]|uniref:Uncharacterized protein n=1 Tax=Eumeta variegata TaxID=151549 RepID=A0A4C2A522_EUMVA|nr:hypothetical protein EVAR_102927_1 [Eumeta japonica]